MGSSVLGRSLVARSLSGGAIAGVVVGVVLGLLLIFSLLALPFILRHFRDARAERERLAEAAEMGIAPGAPAASFAAASPTSARRMSLEHFHPGGEPAQGAAVRPSKELDVDGNSYESTPPKSSFGGQRPGPVLPRLDTAASPSILPPGEGGVRSESPKELEEAQSPDGRTSVASESEWRKNRKSSKGSISHVIEGIANAVFRHSSTRSERSMHLRSPVRSPTREMDDTLAPAIPPNQVFSNDEPIPMTGEARWYYETPMSPPEMEDDSPLPPSGIMPTNLMSFSAATAVASTPLEPKRKATQSTTYSPITPDVSPAVKVEDSFPEDDEDDTFRPPRQELSPSRFIPSPPSPPSGTVNPLDTWNPTNQAERVHRTNADLYRIEHSPPPAPAPAPINAAMDATDTQPAPDDMENGDYMNEFVNLEPHNPSGTDAYTTMSVPPVINEPPMTPSNHQQQAFIPPTPETQTGWTTDGRYTPQPPSLSPNSTADNSSTPLTVPSTSVYNSTPSPGPSNSATSPDNSTADGASPRSFRCEQCDRDFDQIHKLNHHKRYHERPHECTFDGCGRRFGTKTHLDRHVNDKHTKGKKFHCLEPNCPYSFLGGKSFPRKDNWRRHMLNKHGYNPVQDPIEITVDQHMTGT